MHGLPPITTQPFWKLEMQLSARLRHVPAIRRLSVTPVCSVRTSRGKRYEPDQIKVKMPVGEGSFGQVFQGLLETSDEEHPVILKRVKDRVTGAQEMAAMEHLLNVHASAVCKRSVAPFLGYLEVEEAQGKLTKGLWLVWGYEGNRTLAYYLRRRDCIAALAADLDVPEDAVVPTVMQQIFACLADVHSVGLVHRDVKPANIIFCDDERRFKLIDLGAAADLRTGTNYKPAETILDPCYCPPEEYCMPTDSPHLAQHSAPLALAMSPLLWSQHRPDAFDAWSCGVVLLQLALPFLRTTTALRNWKATYARCGYDLEEWRLRASLPAKATALLDADGGRGWELAAELLRPREVEKDAKGGVRFVNTGVSPRLTPAAALRHPFLQKAVGRRGAGLASFSFGSLFGAGASSSIAEDEAAEEEEQRTEARGSAGRSRSAVGSSGSSKGAHILDAAPTSTSGGGSGKKKASIWDRMKSGLFDLQARVMQEASETQTQTTIVQQLRAEVAAGRAEPSELERAESVLEGMQAALRTSVKELSSVYSGARGFLSSLRGEQGGSRSSAEGSAAAGSGSSSSRSTDGAAAGSLTAAAAVSSPASSQDEAVAEPSPQQQRGGLASALFAGATKAVGAVSGVAAAVEKSISRAQAEAAARRAASAAYGAALRTLLPAIAGDSSWEQVGRVLPEDEAYSVLTELQRKQLFVSYVDEIRRAERAATKRAIADLQALFEEAAPADGARYEQLAQLVRKDARFKAVQSEQDRIDAFNAAVASLRATREQAARRELAAAELAARLAADAVRAATAEAEFRRLMQQHEGLVVGGASWAELKRTMWADPRWGAVPEPRRKALHAEYVDILKEAGVTAALAAQRTQPLQARSSDGGAAAGQGGASLDQLEYLREEQARLKVEYEKMEGKLRAMEQALHVQDLVGALMDDGSVVESDDEGNMVFKFPAGVRSLINKQNGAGRR